MFLKYIYIYNSHTLVFWFAMPTTRRRSVDNYVENIASPKFQIQESDPYLMYRAPNDQIVGIWFYDAEERVALAKLLREITQSYVERAAAAAAASSASSSSSSSSPTTRPRVLPLLASPLLTTALSLLSNMHDTVDFTKTHSLRFNDRKFDIV